MSNIQLLYRLKGFYFTDYENFTLQIMKHILKTTIMEHIIGRISE